MASNSAAHLGFPSMRPRIHTDLLALALLAVAVFLGLALGTYDPADPPGTRIYPPNSHVSNAAGPVGAMAADGLLSLLGVSAYVLLLAVVVLDARLFARKSYPDPLTRTFGFLLLLVTIGTAARIVWWGPWHGPVVGVGGYVGAWGQVLLSDHIHPAGTGLLLACCFTSGMLLTTDYLMFHAAAVVLTFPMAIVNRLGFGRDVPPDEAQPSVPPPVVEETGPVIRQPAPPPAESRAPVRSMPPLDVEADEQPTESPLRAVITNVARAIGVNPPPPAPQPAPPRPVNVRANGLPQPASLALSSLPGLELLEEAEDFPYEYLAEKARGAATILERTFQEFGLNVKVVEIDTGPVITQFELELEAGLRLSKVTALGDDLAIALRVPSVRVVAPIPGRNTVGVEVPNDRRVMVRLKELIETTAEQTAKTRIPLFLGKDVGGQALLVDMTKLPHLLIAGRTGTGKSVCLNTLILSILMTRRPEDVKLLMIDPKMVELSPYMRVPHLMHPVITDMKKAEAVLGWAVDKMEERYDLLARCQVRHLDSYNQLTREERFRRLGLLDDGDEGDSVPDHMPYIVIIADEFADLIMTSGKEVEGHIIRLAQKSRAVGIHLVLATQKPTVDVITGLIKSNLPARISFQVASRTDSRVVLDEMGADKLLGNGDMLYLAPGTSNISRAQGTYVSDEEVMRIIDFFKDCPPQYSKELSALKTATSATGGKQGIEAIRARDELYEQAIEIVLRERRGSTSLLQRAMGIGYGRAARLIDYMAEDGIVGDYNGSQAREVLLSMDDWDAMKGEESALAD
jgi:DNA segregation ATPase FtsK/SpoIIIE, S-DNA-T family